MMLITGTLCMLYHSPISPLYIACTLSLLTHVHSLSSDASEIVIEENTQFIELEIWRAFGTFGEIAVALNTVDESAISPSGRLELTSLYVFSTYLFCSQVTDYHSV